MKIAVQVPIKGKSSLRVPNKNFRNLNGKPLCYWVLDELVKLPADIDIFIDSEEKNRLQDLKHQIQQFLRKKGNLVQLILKCNSINNETCVLLSTLFQENLISKLLSNFTFKIAPVLLNWRDVSEDERFEVLRETKDMLHEIYSLEIKLQNLS